jgi:hypothetical protein
MGNYGTLKTERVCIAYELDKFMQLKAQLDLSRKEFYKIFSEETKSLPKDKEIDQTKLSAKYQAIKKKVEEQQKLLFEEEEQLVVHKRPNTSKGVAFVTFDNKNMYERVLSFYGADESGFWSKLCGSKKGTPYTTHLNGNAVTTNIQVITAPAPTDIMWDNIGLSTIEIAKRRLITIFLSLLLLGVCFAIMLGLKVAQDKAAKSQAASAAAGQVTSSVGVRLLSIVISLLILIINNVLAIVLQKLTIYERHSDHTDKNRSMILKICVSQFINTCLLIVAVHAIIIKPTEVLEAKGKIFFLVLINLILRWSAYRRLLHSHLRFVHYPAHDLIRSIFLHEIVQTQLTKTRTQQTKQ